MSEPHHGSRCTISLAEWIILSASLRNYQAADARIETSPAFIGRAARIALFVVDALRVNQEHDIQSDTEKFSHIQAEDIVAKNFAVGIGIAIDSDIRDWKKSPQQLLAALESVTDVRISESLLYKYALQDDIQTMHKLGLLLFEIFSGGKIAPPGVVKKNNGVKIPSAVSETEKARELFHETTLDEEQPGPEKGRQKRSVGDTRKHFRRIHVSDFEDSLLQLSVPASISTLLKDLIQPVHDNDNEFQSLEEVSGELRQIIAFLSSENADTLQEGVLDFGKIIGRTEEMRCLLEAAARIEIEGDETSQPNALVLIGGEPGIGKTYLVESVRGSFTRRGWIYLSCKFDRLMHDQMSTIASAFEKFFQHLVSLANEGGGDVDDILASIKDNLSASGIVVLSELIPSLRTLYPTVFASLVEDDSSQSSEEDRETTEDKHNDDSIIDDEIMASAICLRNRIHYLFKMLVKAISRPEHPLFLFVDDLQWVDESSIQLLSSLLTESDHLNNDDGHSFLVAASYRTNEMTPNLSLHLDKFNSSASVVVHNIHLDTITKSDANMLVSVALRLPVRQTGALTDALFAKTIGNPLYLQVLMKSMVDEKMLSWSLVQKRWMWNIESIKATSIDDNVAELLTRKLRRLREDSQDALKIVSCFGMHVEESSLRSLLESDTFRTMMPCLETARQEGILEETIDGGLSFVHDMLQQAAYDLILPEERGGYHHTIGVQLTTHISLSKDSNCFNPTTFSAADQINMAKSLTATIEDLLHGNQLSRIEFATLNLKAGKRSMEVSDFSKALNYMQHGISFLPQNNWHTSYELSLQLYEDACLGCYINARPDNMTDFLPEILGNARSFLDKLNCLFVLLQSLTSSGKAKESMGKVLTILDELGEPMPESGVTPSEIQDLMMSTKKSVDGYSKEDFISAPHLNDKRMHWVVKLMAYVLPYTFMYNSSYLPLFACRMLEISTKSGVIGESAFGLLLYGYCHIIYLHDFDEGYRWGKIAVSLLESFNAKRLLPKMKTLAYHFIFCWVEPLQSTSIALLQCHRDALRVGDNEYASFAAQFYSVENILCGSSLPLIEEECTTLALKLVQLNQLAGCLAHLSNHLSVLKLIGSEKNPFEVVGGFMESEDELLDHSLSTGRLALAQSIFSNRLFVAFFFKQYEEAIQYAGKYEGQSTKLNLANQILYTGLTAFHFARHSSDSKHLKTGQESLLTFQTWAYHSAWNWEHKLLLLEAEMHFSTGEMENADEKYILAIKSARQHRFVHEEGLANELYSVFHTENGNSEKAKGCISEARICYKKWGALALVELIDMDGN